MILILVYEVVWLGVFDALTADPDIVQMILKSLAAAIINKRYLPTWYSLTPWYVCVSVPVVVYLITLSVMYVQGDEQTQINSDIDAIIGCFVSWRSGQLFNRNTYLVFTYLLT